MSNIAMVSVNLVRMLGNLAHFRDARRLTCLVNGTLGIASVECTRLVVDIRTLGWWIDWWTVRRSVIRRSVAFAFTFRGL